MNTAPAPGSRSRYLLWSVLGIGVLLAFTAANHWLWVRAGFFLNGLVAFFLGTIVLLLLQAVLRLGVGAIRNGMRWLVSRDALRICTWTGLFAVSALFLFYNIELWQGKRAWVALATLASQKGESLRLKEILPGPVPDSENFARAACFGAIYTNPTPRYPSDLGEWSRMSDWERRPMRWYGPKECPWVEQQATDFRQWLEFLRTPDSEPRHEEDFRARRTRPDPDPDRAATAKLLLEEMNSLDPQIQQVRAASERPYCRFPLDYSRQVMAANDAATVLNGLTRMIRVRASAELGAGYADRGFEDARLALKVADYARQQPWPFRYELRLSILADALQPIWEGLASRQWREPQLALLQKDLQNLNPLADYPMHLRVSAFALADFCETVIPTSRSAARLPMVFDKPSDQRTLFWVRAIYPTGWSLQDQAALHRESFRMLDLFKNRQETRRREVAIDLLRSSSDPFFPVLVVPRAVELSTENQMFYFAQSAADEAALGCAIERFRLANGKLPPSLDALVPRFIARVPRDPVVNEPLRYRLADKDQFVLYSVGMNSVDESGLVEIDRSRTHFHLRDTISRGDWVWRYHANAR